MHDLGCGTDWARRWVHRGFRLELGIRWNYGITSTRETWSGGSWTSPAALPTAQAHSEILDWSERNSVKVEPLAGQPMPVWVAQAFEVGLSLRDTRGIAHPGLELALVSRRLVRNVSLIQASSSGWGIGPWGLMPWGE